MGTRSIHGAAFGFDSQSNEVLFNGQRFGVGASVPRARGRDYYVSSVIGQSGRTGKSYKESLATIAQAVAKCTASQGDRVIVLEGHAETLSSATALAIATA